jgi:flagellar basal-body rod modification protein FlgD
MSTITTPDAFAASAASTGAAATSTSASSGPAQIANPSSTLGDNTFLQLMVTQLQDQDPLNPTDTSSYLSELAQFTSLEQETNTATATQQTATANATTEALSLLGTNVSYTATDGSTQSGVVSAVDLSGASPTLTIGGDTGIATAAVTEVS